VGLAQAILHNPEVLILDEPTSGLDPNQLIGIRQLITELGKTKTIILSTHIMQEVEAVCNKVIIIDKGKIVANDTLQGLRQQNNGSTLEQIFISLTAN
jgi:ABC-2 type transport system ATP-binding protein